MSGFSLAGFGERLATAGTDLGFLPILLEKKQVASSVQRWAWAVVLMLALGGQQAARGHDLWLEVDPIATGAAKTEERALHLRMGEAFAAEEEKPLLKKAVSRFDLYADRKGRRDLLDAGQEGQNPVAKLPPEPGTCLVVMDRKARQITLDHEKFNRYLAEEGQDAVLAQRTRLGQTDAEGHETYTRCLKALVPGMDPTSTVPNTFYKRRMGQRLEILLQNNPGRLTANRKLTVKVLFDGEPLTGAKVFAYRHQAGVAQVGVGLGTTLSGVTSGQGLVDFKLDQNGVWLVRLTHMRAGAERKTNPNGAWESFWSAYSFVVRDAPVLAAGPGATAIPTRPGVGGAGDEKKE